VSPGCEEQQEHQQQPLQVEDGVAVAALQHSDQPKSSSMDSLTRRTVILNVYYVTRDLFCKRTIVFQTFFDHCFCVTCINSLLASVKLLTYSAGKLIDTLFNKVAALIGQLSISTSYWLPGTLDKIC
jgi:hypothetical protein